MLLICVCLYVHVMCVCLSEMLKLSKFFYGMILVSHTEKIKNNKNFLNAKLLENDLLDQLEFSSNFVDCAHISFLITTLS